MRERRCPDLRSRPGGSIIGFGHWVPDRCRPAIARCNLRRGSAKPLLARPDVSAEGRAGVGSGHQLSARSTPSGWTRPLPSRGVPTTIETASRLKAWHVVNPLRTPHKMGSVRTCSRLEAVTYRECSPSAVLSPRDGGRFRPGGEKTKRGWGRPAQRSSDDEFPSPFWPSELSPSLPSIGFLMTRFWTIGAGAALVGPGGDIGPRA